MRRVLVWAAVAALAGATVGIAARALAVHPLRVTSNSMSPAMELGDWLVVSDLDGGRDEVGPRDVVVFRYPLGSTGRAVKRIVAVGGDTVVFTDRSLRVDGRSVPLAGTPEPAPGVHTVRVPDGHVFLLGDNAAVSLDSRSFGTVPESELVGRVRVAIPAPSWSWAVLLGAAALGAAGLAAVAQRKWRS